jgi:hypothetical protein
MLMKYSRADEAQADSVGAIIMYKAGYNPKAMADFFSILEKKYGSGGPQMLSDHPNPGNREASVEKEIQAWPPKNYTNDSSQFASAKQQAASVKIYTAQQIDAGAKQGTWAQQNQKNGAVPPKAQTQGGSGQAPAPGGGDVTNVSYSQVQPSSTFKQLQQGGLSISYPDNWQTNGDQNMALIAPPAGAGQTGIAYGVVIGSQQASADLDQAAKQVVQSVIQDNAGMQADGSISNIDVNGVQGRSTFLRGNSPVQENGKPAPERDWLVIVPNPRGGVTYLVFVSPERDFNKLQPVYKKMLQSLRLG